MMVFMPALMRVSCNSILYNGPLDMAPVANIVLVMEDLLLETANTLFCCSVITLALDITIDC